MRRPHLYFAPITDMKDRTELGAELIIPPQGDAIEAHVNDYLSVLLTFQKLEYQRFLKHVIHASENVEAWERAVRRAGRLSEFNQRIVYAKAMLKSVRETSGEGARKILLDFYEAIRDTLHDATVCCLTKSPNALKLWEDYADLHRGVCFQFRDGIFSKNKKVERVNVVYTSDAQLRPLDIGYLRTYRSLYSTKHLSYSHEEEVRFFHYGAAHPADIASSHLTAVILGSETLSPLANDRMDALRQTNIRLLYQAIRQRNALRNAEHATPLYMAKWVGLRLYIREISGLVYADPL